jgi:hypothetical protein
MEVLKIQQKNRVGLFVHLATDVKIKVDTQSVVIALGVTILREKLSQITMIFATAKMES